MRSAPFRTLTAYRVIVDRLIASHRGRIFNTAGDSVLADFASAVDAVQCAVEVQEAVGKENADRSPDEQMRFRIGIHVGDIIVQGDNLFGDGVNVAARLEALAEPGGWCEPFRELICNDRGMLWSSLGSRAKSDFWACAGSRLGVNSGPSPQPPLTPPPHQIPIEASLPLPPRVRSSEAFRRRPPTLNRSLAPGRHPKPFTKPAIQIRAERIA